MDYLKMMKIEVKNLKGEKVDTLELSQEIFGLALNEKLVHQVYVSQYSNRRRNLADTKGRGERSGSGRKPWKQKGTGRARTGSIRNPIWRKGGIIFGPTSERNFSKKINKKENQLAIKMVLSGKFRDQELIVVDENIFEKNKTKVAAEFVKKTISSGSILWSFKKEEKDGMMATRNIEKVTNIPVDSLNVLDMLNNKYLVLSRAGLALIEERYSQK